ncbi:right-handed parallel beta-helix repeat-containing protein [Natronorubrum sp. DTA7]|uniref:right-handed parallel beta-helix repeat-containing protein n=1 Tax=Natronorubrum sp. DTA7 TaxID=3447016 RepID=UPI003F86AFB2
MTIEGNTIANHDGGISIWTPDAVVRDNTISDHTVFGVNLRTGSGSQNAHDAVIENNIFDNEGTSVAARSVQNTELRNNTFAGSGTDIDLEFGSTAVLTDNELTTGLLLDGGSLTHFDHDVADNTINGDPFVYVNGENSPTIPTDAGQIVVVNSTDVDVSGFEFDGLTAGIQVAYSPGAVVADNIVTNTTGSGIRLWSSGGAVVENNVVSQAVLGSDTSDPAIGVGGSSGATVANNEIKETDGRAVRVTSSPNVEIRENTLTDNYGGLFLSTSDDATVADNTISGTHHGGGNVGSFRAAILVTSGERIQFTGNHIHDNAGNGIHDNRNSAPRYAMMTDNVITNNDKSGIYWGNARDATFTNNTVSNNGGSGIRGPYGATVTENTVEQNAGAGIGVSHESSVEANVVHSNGGNGVMVNENSVVRDNTISDSGGSGISLRYYADQTIENNDVSGHDVDLVIFETEAVTVRDNTFETGVQLISSSNPYSTLAEDLTTHSFSGNTVAGKELYYATDANNPSVPADPGQVIIVNSTSVTVSGLEFDGVTAPIQIAFSDATVTDNAVSNSTGSTVQRVGAITLWASDNSLVADNVVTASANDGLRVVESEGVDLARNTVIDSGRNGIQLEGATNTTISDDTISNVGSRGLLVERSAGLTLNGVTVENSGWDGLSIDRSDGTTITGSTITGTDRRGIYLRSTDGAVLEGNTVTTSGDSGIESDFGWVSSDNATVTGNTVTDNGDAGIDFGASGLEGTEISSNTVSGNSIGIAVTNDAVVTDNEVTNNLEAGIEIAFEPVGIRITDNEIMSNGIGVDYDRGTWSNYEAVNATQNWWGVANGPSGGVVDPVTGTVANGNGDSVTENVRFDPWTGDAPTETAFFDVSIVSTNAPVSETESLTIEVAVENTGNAQGTQAVTLERFDGTVVDTASVTLEADQQETVTLEWETVAGDAGTGVITIRTDDSTDSETVVIEDSAEPEPETSQLVIDEPGVYTLTEDLTAGETAVTITSSNVIFDGMGHTITGDGSDDTSKEGVLVYNSAERIENVTVQNLTLDGYGTGVRFWNVDEGEGHGITVENSHTGILLTRTHDGTFSDLTLRNNDGRALSLSSSNGNVISGVEATDNEAETTFNGRGSIYLFSANNNEFSDLAVTGGRSGVRISFSSNNEFVGLTTENHANYGLEIGSSNNTFTDVVANDNGWHGIQIQTASFNTFENVSVTGTDGSAVRLTGIGGSGGSPQNNVFETLSVTDNDGSAVSLSIANYNTFRNLTTASNTGTAVTFVSRSEGNLVEFGELDHGSNTAVNFGSDSIGNTVREVSLRGTGTPFFAQDGHPNNVFDRVDLGGTVVSLSAQSIGTDRASPSTLPADATPLDAYLGITPYAFGTPHVEYLHFHYDSSDVESLDESTLAVWRLADGEWVAPTDATYVTGVDTDQQYVYATGINESHLSATFGVFAPEPAPKLAVTNTELSANTIFKNDSVTITADIENVGAGTGNATVELTIDGQVVDTETFDLDVGETDSVEFTHTFAQAGQFNIEVGGEPAGTVTVIESAEVVIYGASVDRPDQVEPGDTITVTGRLYNTAPLATSEEVALEVDGTAVDEATVQINGTSIKRVELSWTPEEGDLNGSDSADFALTLDGFVVETVTVEHLVSDIQVIAASASKSELVAGESASVVGSIYQAGNYAGTETITLSATKNGSTETIGSQDVTLAPGHYHLGAINITAQFDDPGTYEITLGDRSAGTIEVEPAYSDIQVIAASASADELVAGEELSVIGSIYQAGTTEGPQTITLTATNTDTNGSTEIVGNQTVTLKPGFYHLGALNVSFAPEEAGTYTLELGGRSAGTVEVAAAESDIRVIAASVSDDDVIEDEELYVIGSLYQAGTIEGPQSITLTATNTDTGAVTPLDSHEATLNPGFYHLGAVNISFALDEAGTYEIKLGDRSAGTVEVEAAISDVQVIAASASTDELVAGEELSVVGSIYQAGTINGPQTITLTATNESGTHVVNTQEVTLKPGFYHLGALNLSFTPQTPGTYDLELGGQHAGTVEVLPAESDIRVIAASVSDDDVIEDEELYVVGSLYQAGTIEGPQTITLTATDTETDESSVVASREVTLTPGFYHLGGLNVSFALDDSGTYDIELGGQPAGTVTVEPAESDIRVISASLSAIEVVENEELQVVGSIYQAGTIAGPETINVTATKNGSSEVVANESVTLTPGFYSLGGLNASFALDEPGTYDITLGDRSAGTVYVDENPSDIQVIAASLSEIEVLEGEELYVVASIYQAGESGTEEIELTATKNGTTQVVGSQEVTLNSGVYHLGALNISFTLDEPGTYDLELGGQDAGTVDVIEAYSDIRVVAAAAAADELVAGDSVNVIGSVYQAGTINGPQEIELTATKDGDTEGIDSRIVSLTPGFYHLGALNISFALEEPGTYDLELGDRDAGTVEVLPAESDIQVIAAAASADEAVEGDELSVIGSLYQTGTIAGPEEIELTATNTDTDAVTTLGSHEATLDPGFYHLGAVNISFVLGEPGTYDLELGGQDAGTVTVVAAESSIDVIAASVSDDDVVEGEELYVVGSLYQAGTIAGPEEIELTATSTDTGAVTSLGSHEATLNPGFYHLGAVNISFALDDPGTYDLTLGNRNAGTVEVRAAVSDIDVIAATASTDRIAQTEDLYVIGSLYQAGTDEGPETITLSATDTDSGQTTVVGTHEATLQPGFYHLGAVNISFALTESGTYDLALGDRDAGTVEVVPPTVDPTITAVNGHSTATKPETGETLVYTNADTTVDIRVTADLDIDDAELLIESRATRFAISTPATNSGGNTWSATVPVDSIPDDGEYDVSVVVTDVLDTPGFDAADEVLVIDRDSPATSVSIEDVDSNDATIVVESDEPLLELSSVTATLIAQDGSTATEPITMTRATDTRFTGTLEFDDSGEYSVTAVGVDRAGNEGTDTASVTINTGFTLNDGEIIIDESGTSIAFTVADDADEAIKAQELFLALSENSVNPNVDGGDLGVGFITAELDSFLDYQLERGTIEGATISLAVDESALPSGVSAADAQIHYYDQSTNQWDPVETDYTVVDDEPFLVSTVTHFSTYGALIADEEPPQLVDVSTIESDGSVTVRFEYEDAISGVNVSAVSLSLDETDVTQGSQITSSTAEYTVDGEAGSSYTVELFVVDNAGNVATFETSVTVPGSGSSGSGSSGSDSPWDTTDPADDSGSDDPGDDQDGSSDSDTDDAGGDQDGSSDADTDRDETESDEGTGDGDQSESTTEPDTEDDGERDDSVPGFGVVLTLIVVLTIALAAGRRRCR